MDTQRYTHKLYLSTCTLLCCCPVQNSHNLVFTRLSTSMYLLCSAVNTKFCTEKQLHSNPSNNKNTPTPCPHPQQVKLLFTRPYGPSLHHSHSTRLSANQRPPLSTISGNTLQRLRQPSKQQAGEDNTAILHSCSLTPIIKCHRQPDHHRRLPANTSDRCRGPHKQHHAHKSSGDHGPAQPCLPRVLETRGHQRAHR